MERPRTNSFRYKNSSCKIRVSRPCWSFPLRCCRNYPQRVCSYRHHSEQSLLFRSHVTCLCARALLDQSSSKATVAGQHAQPLCSECQFLAPKSICVEQHLPTRHTWHRQPFFFFLKMKRPLKGEGFSDISDTQNGVTELWKGFHCRTSSALSISCKNDVNVTCSWRAIILKVCNRNTVRLCS